MATQSVSLTAPTDYGAEAERIARQRKMAEALQAQSMEGAPAGQMAGNTFVATSPLTHLAKALQGMNARGYQQQSDDESKALATKYQADLADVLRRGGEAQAGRAASTLQPDPQEAAQSADYGTPQVGPVQQPAQAPDPVGAASIYMSHPATMPMGMQQMQQNSQMQSLVNALGGSGQAVGGAGQAPAAGGVPGAVAPQGGAASASGLPPLSLLAAGAPGMKVFETLAANSKPSDKMRELISRGVQPGSPQWNAELGTHFNQGGAWNVGPNGSVNLAPGYAGGQGAIKLSEGQAAAQNAPATVRIGATEVQTTQAIANALNTGVAPDEQTALLANQLASRHGATASVGTDGRIGGGLNRPAPERPAPAAPSGEPVKIGVVPNKAEEAGQIEAAKERIKAIREMADSSRASAAGAMDTLETVDRMKDAIAKGAVTLGPGAPLKQRIRQFGSALNIAGADDNEILVNTSQVMRGLAEFTLAARGALKGQGTITDNEGRLLERAKSGDIGNFTMPEFKAFLTVTERLADKAYQGHERILGVMKKDKNVSDFVPYYDVPNSRRGRTPIDPATQALIDKYAPK